MASTASIELEVSLVGYLIASRYYGVSGSSNPMFLILILSSTFSFPLESAVIILSDIVAHS